MMARSQEARQPVAITRKEAARELRLSLRTLDRAIKRGDLRVKKYGTRVLVPVSEFERFGKADEAPAL